MLSPAHCSASPCHCTPPFCSFWCSFDERWAECVNAFALTLAELTSPSWRSRARRPAGGVLLPRTGRRPLPSPLSPDPCRHHPHTRHTQSHCDTGLATRQPHPSHRTRTTPPTARHTAAPLTCSAALVNCFTNPAACVRAPHAACPPAPHHLTTATITTSTAYR